MKRNYDEAGVVRKLNKKNSVNVNSIYKVVEIVKDSTDVGNGTWGKIDYLCHYHHYSYVFVQSLSRKKIKQVTNDDEPIVSKGKHFNMANMTKDSMRKMR